LGKIIEKMISIRSVPDLAQYLIMLGVLLVAGYTVLYGLEVLKEKNYLGFAAVIVLVGAIIALPVYLLFLRG